MKFVKYTLTAFAAATVLSACEGQNIFKRESNPVRNYPRVSESIRTKTGLVPFSQKQGPTPPPPDNTQAICPSPFTVTVEKEVAASLIQFADDSEAHFEISIQNKLGDDFETTISSGRPSRNFTFREINEISKTHKIYQLSWKPKLAPGQNADIKPLVLKFSSEILRDRCNGIATHKINMAVIKSSAAPILAVGGLPQTSINFGQEVPFNVDIEDPTSGGQVPPLLNPIEFRPEADNADVISGVEAASCTNNPKVIPGTKKWKFSCKFLSSALTGVDDYLNSGKTAKAVFFVSARGSNGASSNSHQATIRVKFEKVVVAPSTAGATREDY